MQTTNRLFDDLAKVANGAVSTLSGMKGEIEAMVRQRVERIMSDADMVPRDEFEAVKAMAAEARRQNEELEARIATLEGRLGSKPAKAKPSVGKTARKTAKSASKPRAKTATGKPRS